MKRDASSSGQTVLIADDEPNIRRVLEALLTRSGYNVLIAENGKKALALAASHEVDLLLTDLIMPDMNGVELLRSVKARTPDCAAILITAYGTIKTAVEAIKLGADNYLTKPFELDEVLALVRRALENRDQAPPRPTSRPRRAVGGIEQMVGVSPQMQELFQVVQRAADSRATVLVRGESGTGKELIARALHHHSDRADQPFIAISCAALPETLLESELFGHEKNAFTGAAAQKLGRFELANHGTLFMDEVADIPPALQVKLLRAIQEREFERIGGTKTVRVDVRLIAATNRDVERAVAEGTFRDDLYYRLHVIQITVPPLRDRRDDILPLAEHFLARFSRENRRQVRTLTPAAADLLTGYRYPGNVRELENAIERAVVMADRDATELTPSLLPPTIQRFAAEPS